MAEPGDKKKNRGDWKVVITVTSPGGEVREFSPPMLSPRAGGRVISLATQLCALGSLAYCPACDLAGEHHLSCLVPEHGLACNKKGCPNSVDSRTGVERSTWFYCSVVCADFDNLRRRATLRKERTPPEEWSQIDIDAATR